MLIYLVLQRIVGEIWAEDSFPFFSFLCYIAKASDMDMAMNKDFGFKCSIILTVLF